MINKRRFCALSILVSLPILFPLLGYAANINADPVFSYESQGDRYTFKGLGPVFEFSSTANAVRPFYFEDKVTSEKDVLYPLGQSSPGSSRFVPFFTSVDEEDQKHTDLFPVFYGRYKEIPYWGIFPIYGTMEHRFGFTNARFFLFPLYAKTTLDDTSTYSFIWPIFSFNRGRLYRVFPLYGWEKSSVSTYQFFLWPFFHHERGSDRRMDAVLPLFRYDRGPSHQNISIIWPFFNYSHDDSAHHTSADFPWPLFRIASGAYEETKVFPLYWAKTEGKTYTRKTILWPLWSRTTWHYEDTGSDQETISVLLTNNLTKKVTRDGQTSRRLYLWPFFYSSREGLNSEWHFPAVFPLFFDEGFARTWGPVLSIAEGDSDGTSSKTSILWRTLFWEKKGDTEQWSLSLLLSAMKTPSYRQWGFLGNLLTYRDIIDEDTPR
jgi:hypothetical protein